VSDPGFAGPDAETGGFITLDERVQALPYAGIPKLVLAAGKP